MLFKCLNLNKMFKFNLIKKIKFINNNKRTHKTKYYFQLNKQGYASCFIYFFF